MGFMDKAKKMAEQAQSKLDEVQKDFNAKQGTGGTTGGGPAVEYDQHGRPVKPASDRPIPEPGDSHTQGDPADAFPSAPAPTGGAGDPLTGGAPADADVPPAPADKSPTFPPKAPPAPGTNPGMTSGDPLGG